MLRPLREHFRPEFLNRIDEIVIFRRLADEQLRQIADVLLEETRRRLRAQDVGVEFAPAAVEWLARHGHQPEYGARPLRRTIQREVDNPLSRMLLGGTLPAHSHVRVDVADDKLAFHTEEAERPERPGPRPARRSGRTSRPMRCPSGQRPIVRPSFLAPRLSTAPWMVLSALV